MSVGQYSPYSTGLKLCKGKLWKMYVWNVVYLTFWIKTRYLSKNSLIMVRTLALFTDFYVARLNLPPPPLPLNMLRVKSALSIYLPSLCLYVWLTIFTRCSIEKLFFSVKFLFSSLHWTILCCVIDFEKFSKTINFLQLYHFILIFFF